MDRIKFMRIEGFNNFCLLECSCTSSAVAVYSYELRQMFIYRNCSDPEMLGVKN